MSVDQAPGQTGLELENLIRRIVREELARLLRSPARTLLDDWRQEGPEDAEGDAQLAADALAVLEEYKDTPEAWMKWEDFEAELDRAEAAGELPD